LKTLPITHPELYDLEQIRVIHYTMDKPWDNRLPKDARIPAELHQLWLDKWTALVQDWQAKKLPHPDFVSQLVAV
jgi:hypothetical protein